MIKSTIDKYIRRFREWREERDSQVEMDYFCEMLRENRADATLIRQCIEKYHNYPLVTCRQVELLLEHKFFRGIHQMGRPEYQAVMETLNETHYGMYETRFASRKLKQAAQNPMLCLEAEYIVLNHEYMKRNIQKPLSLDEMSEREVAHRLLNFCMRKEDLNALKSLALKGERPDDSVIIRHGLADGYRRIEILKQEWNEEQRADNHFIMEQIELRIAEEKGKLMRHATALFERMMKDRLPKDYSDWLKKEIEVLRRLTLNGWDGQQTIAQEIINKYGMTWDFSEISRLMWDHHLNEDNGELSQHYPEATISRHNHTIQKRAAIELEQLETRLRVVTNKAVKRKDKPALLPVLALASRKQGVSKTKNGEYRPDTKRCLA